MTAATETLRVDINADADDLKSALRESSANLKLFGRTTEAEGRKASRTFAEIDRRISSVRTELAEIAVMKADPEVDLDAESFERRAAMLRAEMARLSAMKAEVKVDIDTQGSFASMAGSIGLINQRFALLRNTWSTLKLPAMAGGALAAAKGLIALAGGAVSLVSALAPLSGAVVALPAAFGVLGQAAGVLALAGIGDLTDAVGGLNEELDESSEAFQRLSPEAQAFARRLQDLKAPLRELQADAQGNLFRGADRGLESALGNLDALEAVVDRTSNVLGDLAADAGRFVGREGFGRDFEQVGTTNARLLALMGEAGFNFADALRHVMVEAQPLLLWMARGIVSFSEFIEKQAQAGRESGDLARFFGETREAIQRIVSIGGSLINVLFNIGKAADPFGEDLLVSLRKGANELERITGSVEGQNALRDYFRDSKKTLDDLAAGIGDILDEGSLSKSIARAIELTVPIIAENAGQLGVALAKGLVRGFIDAGVIGKLFTAAAFIRLIGGAGALTKIGSAVGAKILGGFGASTIAGKVGGNLTTPGYTPARPLFVSVVNGGLPGGPGGGAPGGGKPGGGKPPSWITTPLKRLALAAVPIMVAETIRSIRGDWLEKPFKDWSPGMRQGSNAQARLNSPGGIAAIRAGAAGEDFSKLDRAAENVRALREEVRRLKQAGEAIPADMLRKAGLNPNAVRAAGHEVTGTLDKTGKSWRDYAALVDGTEGRFDRLTRQFKEQYGSLAVAAVNMGKRQEGAYRDAARVALRNGDLTRQEYRRIIDALDNAGERTKRMWQQASRVTGESAAQIKRATRGMTVSVAKDYDNMVNVVGGGLHILTENTRKALQAVGLKQELKWQVTRSDGAGGIAGHPQARGGFVAMAKGGLATVQGQGLADTVPLVANGVAKAVVAPGEDLAVINRHQRPMLDAAVSAAYGVNGLSGFFRQNDRPHYMAKGGLVGGDSGAGMAAMLALANKYERASFPYLWGGGHGSFPGGTMAVDCSGAVSDILHAGGLLDGAPMVSGALMNWGKPAKGNEPLVVYANPGHTVMKLNGRVFGTSGSNPGGGAGWIEGGNGASLAPGAMRTMDVAGGAVAREIKRMILEGPKGAMTDGGQAALDKVWKQANKKIAESMPSGSFGGGDVGSNYTGPLDRIFPHWTTLSNPGIQLSSEQVLSLTRKAGLPAVFDEVAYRESGRHPGIMGLDPGGTRGLGLWMITTGFNDALIRSFGGESQMANPWVNAQAAKKLYDAGGLQPWAPSGPYQRGGLLDGLAHGGLVGMAKGGKFNANLPDLDVRQLIGRVGKVDDKKQAKLLKRFGEKIDDFHLDRDLKQKIKRTTADVAEYTEAAGDAGRLSGDSGFLTEFRGKTEAEWYQRALPKLTKLRNLLITADNHLDRMRAALEKQEKKARDELRRIAQKLRRVEDERDKLEKKEDPSKDDKDRIERLDEEAKKLQAREGVLRNTLIPRIHGEVKAIGAEDRENLSALVTVQGTGASMRKRQRLPDPPPWLFGGQILDVQSNLKRLGAEASATDPELASLLREELNASRLTAALSESQFGVFRGFFDEFRTQMPFVGAYDHGGRIPRTGFARVHRDELIVPDPQGPFVNTVAQTPAGPTEIKIYVEGDAAPLLKRIRAEVDGRAPKVTNRKIGRSSRQLAVAPGR